MSALNWEYLYEKLELQKCVREVETRFGPAVYSLELFASKDKFEANKLKISLEIGMW